MTDTLVPCIVCGRTLTNYSERADVNQPSGGTAFASGGHYGSTAFDALNASVIEINFCDDCLRAAAKQHRVLWRREAKALVGAPPWRESIFGWIEDHGQPKIWDADDPTFDELVTHEVASRDDLLALIEERGIRSYGGVKLNGGFTPDTAWPEGLAYDDEEGE